MSGPGAVASWQGQTYAAFRPSYPPDLYQHILDYARPESRGMAVDLGCGSGQATADLASLFDRVVGVDASAEQLAHAPKDLSNAEFRCSPVEATGLPNACADIITAATSLHWFEQPAAYEEIWRILKPGGALAAFSYTPWAGLPTPDEGSPAGARECAEQAHAEAVAALRAHIHPHLHRLLEDRSYAGYAPPVEQGWTDVRLDSVEMHKTLSVDQLAGWVQSWSAFKPYSEQHGEQAAQELLGR